MPASRRERSRSPTRNTIKLHISKLPVGISNSQLSSVFSPYGSVLSLRIIRNDPKGIPLKHFNYAFVEMFGSEAERAMKNLRQAGWEVNLGHNSVPQEKELIWSGFLSRSKKHRVGVDAYRVKGTFEFPESLYHLDISYRSPYPDSASFKSLLLLEADNETQEAEFKKYIEYFETRGKAGFIPLGKQSLYIVPPGDFAKTICPYINNKQMLALVLDVTQPSTNAGMQQLKQMLESRIF